MAFGLVAVAYILALIFTIALIFLTIFHVISFDELKTDHKNPVDQCKSLNPLVLPEYLLHGAYTVLFIITFQLGTAIFNIPLMAYHVYRYMHRPVIRGPGLYDPTTIMNTDELNKAMREGWVKLAFYIISFFYYLYGMSLICSLSNEVPEHPVISPKSGHVFERRVIEKYLQENGTDPIDQQPLTVEELIEIKTSPFVRPKPPSATSIPAILKTLQDEWDAVMLQSFTLRQQLQTARQELSHALYQHDAACRVIARLTKEVTAAREALATLKPQAGIMAPGAAAAPASAPAAPGAQQVTDTTGDTVMIDANQLQEEIGVSDAVVQTLQERASQLTAERKRRGKTVPEGLAKSRNISEYQQLSSLVGLHSASMPGILSVDISKASPDRIVTGGNDKNAVVFNLASSQVISILRGHTKKVTNVVYHPAEELVFTGSPDTTVRVWGVEQGQCASVIRAHKGAVTGLSIHATGDYLLSSSADGQWAFSDLRHGRVLVRVSAVDKSGALQSLTCAQFHPDGLILGTGTGDGEVKIWDVKERRNVANFGHGTAGANQTVTALAFSENGYYLATGGADGQVKLWDLRKLKNFKTLVPGEEQPAAYEIHDIEFDQSGSYLGVAGTDCRIYLCKQWDQLALFNDHTAPATGCRFGENANRFITVSLDRSVKVFGL